MTDIDADRIARAIDPGKLPTPEQRDMIEAPFAPLLVVAGAGAGKTETMSQRVLYAIATGRTEPGGVLGLTFTRKAAGELSERVRHRLRTLRASGLWAPGGAEEAPGATGAGSLEADRPRVTTYNAFAAEIVSEFALRVGEDPGAGLMTDARRWQLAEEVVSTWPEDLPTEASLSGVVDAVLQLSGALDEHLRTPEEARAELLDLAEGFVLANPKLKEHDVLVSLEARAALMPVVEAFRARARAEGLVDFGGQVALAVRIARIPEVRELLRERHPVVMLDEYQDTSVAQVELLSTLFGDGHPVTAVGDPQQAIYGWRGASSGAMNQFHERFRSAGHEGTRTLSLSTSWRNDEAILRLANEVARIGGGAPGDQPALQARPGAGPGRVLHHRAQDAEAEIAAIADHFATTWNVEHRRWVEEGGAETGRPRPATRSAAVLCRRRALFPLLARALEERGVPHRVVGRGGLLQQQEVADVRALLTVVAHPERGDAAVHLLHRLRLGAKDVAALHAQARGAVADAVAGLTGDEERRERVDVHEEATLVEVLSRPTNRAVDVTSHVEPPAELGRFEISPAGRTRLTHLLDVLDTVRAQGTLPLGELVALTERSLGLDMEVAARGDRGARAALDAFAREAARFAADAPGAQLPTFLDWLEQLEAHERVNMPEEDVSGVDTEVLLMTVHAAKGLEWDVVAVPELVEGRFPGYRSRPREDEAVSTSAWLTDLGALPYPLRGDAEDLPQFGEGEVPPLVGGWERKKDLDAAIDAYKLHVGAHTVREERNVAYVAFTRARSELLVTSSCAARAGVELPESRFLTVPARRSPHPVTAPLEVTAPAGAGDEGVPEHDAWPADLLTPRRRATLDVVARAVVADVSDAADATGRDGAGRSSGPGVLPPVPAGAGERVRAWWREADLLLAERARDRNPGAAAGDLGGKLSVTMLVNAGANPAYTARNVLRPVPRPPSYATARGTSLHEWIEQHYRAASLTGTGAGTDLLDARAADGDVGGDVVRLREAFLDSRWAHRRPVALEVELSGHVDGVLVPGKADAVFDDELGCAIVDWKTTAVPRGAAVDRVGLQLHAYRLAWARRTGRPIEEIAGVFVHLREKDRCAVDVELPRLSEQAVIALMREAVTAVRDEVAHLRGEVTTGGTPEPVEPADWEAEDPVVERWRTDLDA